MSTKGQELSIVCDGLGFPEGLRWHQGALWFSDFLHRRVYSLGADGVLQRRAYVGGQPSGIGFLPDGTLLVVSWYEQKLLRVGPEGELVTHASLRDVCVGICNDMLVDPLGRAYVGGLGRDPHGATMDEHVSSKLALVQPDGTVGVAADGFMVPNGIAMSPDRRRVVVAETFSHRLRVFDVADDGTLVDGRVFAELPGFGPDGICMDSSGAVWVAGWTEGNFARVADGGEILEMLETDGRSAMSCVLGGDDLRTLYCATGDADRTRIRSGEGSGRIETARVACPGFELA